MYKIVSCLDTSTSIVSTKLWIWDLASKLVEEWFCKVTDIIDVYSFEKTWLKKEITDFFRTLLKIANDLEFQILEKSIAHGWIHTELWKKYLWMENQYRDIIYKDILLSWWLNGLKNNLDWRKKEIFIEIIEEFIFIKYSSWLIKKDNLLNALAYIYPNKNLKDLQRLINLKISSDRVLNIQKNGYKLESEIYNDKVFNQIKKSKKNLDMMLESHKWDSFPDNHLNDLQLLKNYKVNWWEKYFKHLGYNKF